MGMLAFAFLVLAFLSTLRVRPYMLNNTHNFIQLAKTIILEQRFGDKLAALSPRQRQAYDDANDALTQPKPQLVNDKLTSMARLYPLHQLVQMRML
jgi:hypothetical protein